MFSFIKGTLIQKKASFLVIEAGGIGYKVFTPPHTLSGKEEQTVTLHTSLIIREHAHSLYGFDSEVERDLFETLITISGIGPKTAVGLLSKLNPEVLKEAVLNHNVQLVSSSPGIGKKTAERLIIDLREKIRHFNTHSRNSESSSLYEDAVSALVNLGHSQNSAQKAIDQVLKDQKTKRSLSEIITEALRVR